jgi:hypothetical protein
MRTKEISQNSDLSFSKINTTYFQSLRCANIKFNLLEYNYKSEVCVIHSGMCKKLFRIIILIKESNTAL